MKKLSTVFTLLVLICFLSCLKTDAAAVALSSGETVYATTDVNVRTGPGTGYAIIDVLPCGDSAVCVEAGSDGWSRVIFDGAEGYVRSRYLSGAREQAPDPEHFYFFDDDTAIFEPAHETVYATTTVNVRIGPGTQYEPMGQCAFGESIRRTGIGKNGWSRVVFEDETAYIRSKYLSTTKPAAEPYSGASLYGRLTIPSVGIDVGLYYCFSGAESASTQAQSIVDAEDSAVYLDQARVEGAIIGDHKHQGFSAIRSCVAGVTRAYIDFGTYTQEYICTAIGSGRNTGSDMTDWEGNSLNYGSIPGGLAMYTCNENWKDVTITYWKEA